MAHQSLYRTHRPATFADVVGQEQVTKPLAEAARSKTIGHAYLFAGSRGLGKTSVARIFAREIGCGENDLYEIDAASNNSVEDIRALTEGVYTLPFSSPYKVYILDEVHMLSKGAWNAFLKTLEEPPKDTLILLTSSLPEAILDTILSRCIEIPLITPTNIAKTPDQEKILSALNDCLAAPQRPGVTEAFRFTRAVQETLTDVRERIGKAGDASLKADTARYKQTTDGSWLAEREQQIKAQSESEALRQRDILLQTLFDALATALRSQHGDKSNTHAVAEALAVKFSGTDLLRRLDSLETIRRRLAMGVQEALTLESGFIELIAGNDK